VAPVPVAAQLLGVDRVVVIVLGLLILLFLEELLLLDGLLAARAGLGLLHIDVVF